MEPFLTDSQRTEIITFVVPLRSTIYREALLASLGIGSDFQQAATALIDLTSIKQQVYVRDYYGIFDSSCVRLAPFLHTMNRAAKAFNETLPRTVAQQGCCPILSHSTVTELMIRFHR